MQQAEARISDACDRATRGEPLDDREMLELVTQIAAERHQKPPDVSTQVRQWIGLIVAAGGILWLVAAGRQIGHIESAIASTRDELRAFIVTTDRVNDNLAAILRKIERRTATLEGIEQGRRSRLEGSEDEP